MRGVRSGVSGVSGVRVRGRARGRIMNPDSPAHPPPSRPTRATRWYFLQLGKLRHERKAALLHRLLELRLDDVSAECGAGLLVLLVSSSLLLISSK